MVRAKHAHANKVSKNPKDAVRELKPRCAQGRVPAAGGSRANRACSRREPCAPGARGIGHLLLPRPTARPG